MNFLLSIIPSVLVLGILIVIHELGHFLACRMTNVKVEKFSIGFGPEIFHWESNGTRYALSLFPLGGFVKPAGESVSEVGADGPRPGDYLAAPLFARIFIVAAGVLMNYLLAYVLFAAIFMTGRPVPGTTIGTLIDDYPAKAAGLHPGDTITALNGQAVDSWTELMTALENAPDSGFQVTVERPAEDANSQPAIKSMEMVPKVETLQDVFGKDHRVKRIGITPHPSSRKVEHYGFAAALKEALKMEISLTVLTHKAIFYLLTGRLSLKTVSGPIGIISMTGDAVGLGWPYILQLTATLSVSLAVINLLPIPALDGGHLLFLLIEAIARRRVSLQVQERATQAGFVLLLIFMGFVIYNDLTNMNVFGRIGTMLGR